MFSGYAILVGIVAISILVTGVIALIINKDDQDF